MTATILVVDDSLMLRSVMQRRLKRAGWEVLVASDGAEGVDVARTMLPDLILMDMTMPVMDGWEATRILREDPVTTHIPILAFTAQPVGRQDQDTMAIRCDGHIAKPFEFSDVLDKINRLLTSRPSSGPSEASLPR